MQAVTLMIVYIATLIGTQFVSFLISRLVDLQWPTLGLMTFLVLFIASFGIAWLPAVRLAEWLIRARLCGRNEAERTRARGVISMLAPSFGRL